MDFPIPAVSPHNRPMIFDRFLASPEVMQVLDERTFVQAMLDFEAALARAQAAAGAIPARAGEAIAAACDARGFDVDAIAVEGGRVGTVAIPLVKALTAAVAQVDADAALVVHWGGTTQDVLDTAQVLVTRRALALIDRDLSRLVPALLKLAEAHGGAPMLGRTLMQPAQVISLGFKLAGWIAPLVRAQARLRQAGAAALQLQLGGAVGTRAALGDYGDAVAAGMAELLGLRNPPAAWHTQRDELVALGCELGVLAGSLGKIAKDIALMSQGEVGELAEPSGGGRGGSSAMPHKRNPVAAMTALAAAVRAPQRVAALLAAMPQEHERGLATGRRNWPSSAGCWRACTARSPRSCWPRTACRRFPSACGATSTRCRASYSPRRSRCASRARSASPRRTTGSKACRETPSHAARTCATSRCRP